MADPNRFKWRPCEPEIMLLCLRWYLRSPLSSRDREELLRERGLVVYSTPIFRWLQRYAPELQKRCRARLKPTKDPWRMDETSIQVKGTWVSLYRAADSPGHTLQFMLSETRAAQIMLGTLYDQLAA